MDIVPRVAAFEKRILDALDSDASPLLASLCRLEEVLKIR
jgi:hypothetical protein